MSQPLTRKDFLRMGAGAAASGLLLPPLLGAASAQAGSIGTDRGTGASAGADGWAYAQQILRNIREPVFPDRDFDVSGFGAVGDGKTDATEAFQAAVRHCHDSGGGRVLVPPGTFVTGAIHLRDNVNLHVSEGATIAFSTTPGAYLPAVLTRFEGIEMMNYSPLIYANECTNIAVTGKGTLDGQADWDNWWAWGSRTGEGWDRLQQMADDGVPVAERVFGEGYYLRSSFIQPYRCTNVLVEGVKIVRSPMWEVHPVLSRNVTVRDVHIDSRGPNNDGCDIESSRYVLVRGCTFDVGDDCVAIKSGRDADGLRVDTPSEDILIEDCTMNIRYGAITLGSEMTGGVRNVFVRNCDIGGPNLYFGLYIKTNSHRGGFAENIYLKNINISNLTKEVVSCDFYRSEGDTGPLTPSVRNIELRNMKVGSARGLFYVRGYPRSPVRDFRLVNCEFEDVWGEPPEGWGRTSPGSGVVENVELDFHNVRVNGERVTVGDYLVQ